MFHHGWPLSADDWDNQMMFFFGKGYRVIAHDRRGHGRSSQTSEGNEMDTYAADVAALVAELDLRDAIHIGHSTGGGEVARYVARAEPGRVAKAVLIDAVPPVMVKKESNPGGTPIEVFDGFRAALAANRAQLYLDIPTGPFYGFNRHGAKVSEGLIRNWWPPAGAGTPVWVASISMLSGNARCRSMKERVASIVPWMACSSGIAVVKSRVTSTTGALSGPKDSTLNTAMIGG